MNGPERICSECWSRAERHGYTHQRADGVWCILELTAAGTTLTPVCKHRDGES